MVFVEWITEYILWTFSIILIACHSNTFCELVKPIYKRKYKVVLFDDQIAIFLFYFKLQNNCFAILCFFFFFAIHQYESAISIHKSHPS